MDRKFIISTVVVSIAALLVGFVVHELLLRSSYAKLPNLYRSETSLLQAYFGYLLLGHLFLGAGLTWVYRKGREVAKPFAMQGVRFGAAMIVLTTLPTYLILFAVIQLPSDLVAQQIVFVSISMIFVGVVTAWMNRS